MRKLPKVTFIHLCADNDVNGNPRRCFKVIDDRGRHVETIDEGYGGEGALYIRYPQSNWHYLAEYLGTDDGLSELTVYPTRVDVPVSEYKRALRAEPNSECAGIRTWADAREAKRLATT